MIILNWTLFIVNTYKLLVFSISVAMDGDHFWTDHDSKSYPSLSYEMDKLNWEINLSEIAPRAIVKLPIWMKMDGQL